MKCEKGNENGKGDATNSYVIHQVRIAPPPPTSPAHTHMLLVYPKLAMPSFKMS